MSTTDTPLLPGARAAWVRGARNVGLPLAGGLVCLSSVLMAGMGAAPDAAVGRGLLQLLVVGVPIAVGLYALRTPVNKSFGFALLSVGFAWSLTALSESTLSGPYTIGRLATWLTFPCVVYLLLAFPDGRVERGLDRAVLFGVAGVMLILFFGTAPFVQAFPPKTLWSTCTTDCPANALFVLDEQPAFLMTVVRIREWLVELLWLGLFYSMFRRWRAASPRRRRVIGPAFIAGTLLGLFHYAHITARQLGAPTDTVIALSSAWTFCIVAVCAGFLFGLLWRRMLLAGVLARLGVALRADDDRQRMRDALATALGDTTLQVLFRDPTSDGWLDARGRPSDGPQRLAAGRAATTIDTGDNRHDVALIHDVSLLDDPELLDGVSDIILADWRHARLTLGLGDALHDLQDSRRRIAEAADVGRAQIERDLHDGAQQRLIALRIRLGLAEALVETDRGAAVEEVHQLGVEAERALDELRSLADEVFPAVLTDRGLRDALCSVAAQAPMPVHIVATDVTRQPVEVESAVYFTCVEAVQHAEGSTGVRIKLSQGHDRLHFEIADDGPGFTTNDQDGRGWRTMRDRIEAIGGALTVDARPGRGTRVRGSVELRDGRL
jgi:signal transduction histidine kinase